MRTPMIRTDDPTVLDVYVQGGPQLSVADQRYLSGWDKPNHPVPATMDNAVVALFNQREVTVWSVEWFKRELRRRP